MAAGYRSQYEDALGDIPMIYSEGQGMVPHPAYADQYTELLRQIEADRSGNYFGKLPQLQAGLKFAPNSAYDSQRDARALSSWETTRPDGSKAWAIPARYDKSRNAWSTMNILDSAGGYLPGEEGLTGYERLPEGFKWSDLPMSEKAGEGTWARQAPDPSEMGMALYSQNPNVAFHAKRQPEKEPGFFSDLFSAVGDMPGLRVFGAGAGIASGVNALGLAGSAAGAAAPAAAGSSTTYAGSVLSPGVQMVTQTGGAGLGLGGTAAGGFDAAANWAGIDAAGAGAAGAGGGLGLANTVSAANTAAKVLGGGKTAGDTMSLKDMAVIGGAGAAMLGAGAALGGGKMGTSTQTTSTNVAGKSAAELEAELIALQRLRRQDELEAFLAPAQKKALELSIKQLEDLSARQARLDESFTPEQEAAYLKTERERNTRIASASEELQRMQLETVKRGGAATPEQIALIDAATGAAQKTGEADINRFRLATLRQINEEISTASGMRPTDTPIVRLSERAGEEATRQQGILASRMAETNAQARLNFPLAASTLTSGIATTQQQVAQAAAEFQARLNQQAQENRLRLFQQPIANVMGSGGNANAAGFASTLAGQRIGLGTQTTTQQRGLGLSDIGQFAGGIGSLLYGGDIFARGRGW